MKTRKITYLEFRKRLIEELNAWVSTNCIEEDIEQFSLSDESFDSEIYDTIGEVSTYGFLDSLKRVELNSVEVDFENVMLERSDDDLTESFCGFTRSHSGKSVFIGILFGGDGDFPMNGFIFLNDRNEFCLYVPTKGNPFNADSMKAYSYDDVDEVNTSFYPIDMLDDYESHVKL